MCLNACEFMCVAFTLKLKVIKLYSLNLDSRLKSEALYVWWSWVKQHYKKCFSPIHISLCVKYAVVVTECQGQSINMPNDYLFLYYAEECSKISLSPLILIYQVSSVCRYISNSSM